MCLAAALAACSGHEQQSAAEPTASVTAEEIRRSVNAESSRLIEERVTQRVACRLTKEGVSWLVAEFRLLSEEHVNPTPRN